MANERKKKKNSGGWWWLIFVIVALISQAGESAELRRLWWRLRFMLQYGLRSDNLPLIAGAVLAVIVAVVLIRAAKRRAAADDGRPASARTAAAVQRRDPRAKSFTRPEPYCLVCDHTGEDHFQHDKAQRIRQLDEWLKNGLIDREEYKVLKSRFERDL